MARWQLPLALLLCWQAAHGLAAAVQPEAFLADIRGRDLSRRDYVLLRSELVPAVLVQARLKDVTVFHGGTWQARFVAFAGRDGMRTLSGERIEKAEMSEAWLLAWSGVKDDRPWLVVLQRRPVSVQASGGLNLTFPIEAGLTAKVLPFGREAVDTTGWEKVLPEEAVARSRQWSGLLRRYPVGCSEEYALDEAKDVVTVRDRFTYLEIADDWNTRPLTVAPVPPTLGQAIAEGFPAKIQGEVKDYRARTAFGPFTAVEDKEELVYTIHGMLKYVNEALDVTGAETNAVTRQAMEDMRIFKCSDDQWWQGHGSGESYVTAWERMRAAAWAGEPWSADQVRIVRTAIAKMYFRPEHYFWPERDGRAYACEKNAWLMVSSSNMEGKHGWSAAAVCSVRNAAGNATRLWAYGRASGDWDLLKAEENRRFLQGIYHVLRPMRWDSFQHRDDAPLWDLDHRKSDLWLDDTWDGGHGHPRLLSCLSNGVLTGTISLARLGRMIGDEALYRDCAFLAARRFVEQFVREKAWARAHRDDFLEWLGHYSHSAMHWIGGHPRCPESLRFLKEHVRDDVRRDLEEDLPRRHPQWRESQNNEYWPLWQLSAGHNRADARYRFARLHLAQVFLHVLDKDQAWLERFEADPLTLVEAASRRSWKRLFPPAGDPGAFQAPLDDPGYGMKEVVGQSLYRVQPFIGGMPQWDWRDSYPGRTSLPELLVSEALVDELSDHGQAGRGAWVPAPRSVHPRVVHVGSPALSDARATAIAWHRASWTTEAISCDAKGQPRRPIAKRLGGLAAGASGDLVYAADASARGRGAAAIDRRSGRMAVFRPLEGIPGRLATGARGELLVPLNKVESIDLRDRPKFSAAALAVLVQGSLAPSGLIALNLAEAYCCAAGPSGAIALVGGKDGIARVDLSSGKELSRKDLTGRVEFLVWDSGRTLLYAGVRAFAHAMDYYDDLFQGRVSELRGRDRLLVLDPATLEAKAAWEVPGRIEGLAVVPDRGEVVVAVSFFCSPRAYRLDGNTLTEKTRYPLRDVGGVAALSGGEVIVAGEAQDVVSVIGRSGAVSTLGVGLASGPCEVLPISGATALVGTRSGDLLTLDVAAGRISLLTGPGLDVARDLEPMQEPRAGGILKPVECGWVFRHWGKWKNTFVEPEREEIIYGLDVVTEQARPVRAAADGIVTFAGWKTDDVGQVVILEHAGGWQTRYQHLHRAPCVQAGQAVTKGDMIGRVGDSGISVLGIDLYFEARRHGEPVNPALLFEKQLAGLLEVTDRNLSLMIRNPGFEGAWPKAALDGLASGHPQCFFREPELSIEGRQSLRFGGRVKSPGPGLGFKTAGISYVAPPNTWLVVDDWRYRPPRGMSLGGDVETSFGFPTSRTYGQELHGIMQSNATRFPSPGILGCVAMWSDASGEGHGKSHAYIRQGVWLERRGNWYHFRSVPWNTGNSDSWGYTFQGDAEGAHAPGIEMMKAEGQGDDNTVFFTVDDYRRLECDPIAPGSTTEKGTAP